MVLNRNQYENINNEELIQELNDINSRFVNDINAKLTELSEKFDEFTWKFQKFYFGMHQCKSFNSHLLTRIIQLERNDSVGASFSWGVILNIVEERQLNWTLFVQKFMKIF